MVQGLFCACHYLNPDLSDWNVSNVTDMTYMFLDCKSFNQDLSDWDVSNVRYRISMFKGCPIKEEYTPKFK